MVDPRSHKAFSLRELFDDIVETDPVQRNAKIVGLQLPDDLRIRLQAMVRFDEVVGGFSEHEGGNMSSPELSDDVDRLLQNMLRVDARERAFAREAVAEVVSNLGSDEDLSQALIGNQVGSFRLQSLIGQGGSSVVFRAVREVGDGSQTVALKLMRIGLFSADAQRRFRREQGILAQLTHPNIASLIEGGVSSAGIPYIAMELVDGLPITQAAASRELNIEQRLKRFSELCRAIQTAHVALIVHRDLKPSNLLVTHDGVLKVVDFGIAGLIDDNEYVTRTQSISLTPGYAAPEQFGSAVLTTAVDVYSLGVILGEMLTGQRLNGTISASQSVLSGRDEVLAPLPRGLPSRRILARQLRGDLDVIIACALGDKPALRYASAGAFADDIDRYIAAKPVRAHPPARWYRASKFIGRHRAILSMGAVFVVAILTALGFAVWQAELARDRELLARQQAERAESSRQLLFTVFEQADPDQSKGQPMTARQLLERGEREIEKGNYDRAVRADVATLLAVLSYEIGDLDNARKLVEQALPAGEDETTPADIRARVLIGVSYVEVEENSNDLALQHARQGLALLDDTMPIARVRASLARNTIGHSLINKGEWAEAEKSLRDALRQDVAALGEDSAVLADEWLELGVVLANARKFSESEDAYRRGIAISRAHHGDKSARVAHALNELSNMLSDKGDLVGAERSLREALQIRKETIGDTARDTIVVENNLLVTLEMQGRLEESLQERQRLIATASTSAQVQPAVLAIIYSHTGSDLRDLGRLGESAAALRKAISILDSSLGADSVASVSMLRELGATLVLQGKFAEARSTLDVALGILEKHGSSDSFGIAAVRTQLGVLMRLKGSLPEALAFLEAACDAYRHGDLERGRPIALAALSQAQLDAGDTAKAAENAELSLSLARQIFPAGHYLIGNSLLAQARVYLKTERAHLGEPLLREALAVMSPPYPAGDPRTLEVQAALSDVLLALGRSTEARELRSHIERLVKRLPTSLASAAIK